MDIREVRTELTNALDYSDDYLRAQVKELILKINKHIEEADKTIDTTHAISLLDGYLDQYELYVREYERTPSSKATVLQRLRKGQEILATVDLIVYYMTWIITRCANLPENGRSAINLINRIKEEREDFKGSSIKWTGILSSLNTELKFYIGAQKDV